MSRHATAHATVEDLSAYLDNELEPVRLRLVKAHLEECDECRGRADGLSRVVRDLRRLERFDPPPALGQHFLRRLHRSSQPRGFLQRLEEGLEGRNLQSPIGFSFALVLAFSALLYFFAGSMERHQRSQTAIVRPTLIPTSLPSEQVEPAEVGEAELRKIGEQTFLWQEGQWRQEGIARDASPVSVEAASSQGQQLLLSKPGLALLLDEGAAVVFKTEEGVFLLLPSSPTPKAQE